ncbi:helix-turn-helix domain-containing protein [Exiguobacterium sp. s102]|uniref:helix-turn-helix domain-containing protein n=1 Tax=Exiguobacterium sp. s102 TaxID=2751212 RepID=UPI0020373600|nr:helix-turn-helix domain-containing protein [Exiguobacterium sp. s102]
MANENMTKAIQLMVRTNMSQKEIAKKIGVNETTISRWKQLKDFDEIRFQEERLYLGELASPALRTMRDLLNAKSELVRYNAASDILDRTGFKPIDRQEITGALGVQFIDDIGGEGG